MVIPAVDESVRLSAVLTPLSCVLESSAIATAPAELNVRLPKFMASPAWLPSVIDVPLKLALFATARLAAAALVIPAADESVRLSAVLAPLNCVLEILGDVYRPDGVERQAAEVHRVARLVAQRDRRAAEAGVVGDRQARGGGVGDPRGGGERQAVGRAYAASCVLESSAIATAPAELNVRLPKFRRPPPGCPA